MACLLNLVSSGTLPNQSFLGLEFIVGDPNLQNPIVLSVVVYFIIHLRAFPGTDFSMA